MKQSVLIPGVLIGKPINSAEKKMTHLRFCPQKFCPSFSLLKIVRDKSSITFGDSETYRHSNGSEKVWKMLFHFTDQDISHTVLRLQHFMAWWARDLYCPMGPWFRRAPLLIQCSAVAILKFLIILSLNLCLYVKSHGAMERAHERRGMQYMCPPLLAAPLMFGISSTVWAQNSHGTTTHKSLVRL